MKIAIQGFKASFHEIAALKFFGEGIELLECATFGKLFASVQTGEADYAVCAIENSLAGSILPNYALLRNYDFEIFGEVYLRIEMNLMALPNQRIEDLEEVHSHPIALLQCRNFFEAYPNIQLIESNDTALSAEEIKKHHIKHRGAIASKRAAELYELDILAEDIHDNKRNFTRFLAIKKRDRSLPTTLKQVNKASLSFRAHHSPGSLANVLKIIGDKHINLTKIQSLPVIGEEWQYYMYVDLEFENEKNFLDMTEAILPFTTELKILGAYPAGEKML